MAVEKVWVKNSVITLAVFLMLFVMLQLTLTGAVNVYTSLTIYTAVISLNSSIELIALAMFLMPTVWLGFAAAMSRHRGIYITLTVLTALSLLSSIGFIVYEGYVFSTNNLYITTVGPVIQGIMISKLVCWCILTLLLLVALGVAIAGDCAQQRSHQEYKYSSYQDQPGYPMSYLPPEYAPPRQTKPSRAYEPSRDYPRMMAPPPPARYSEYVGTPRSYYPKY